MQRISDKNRTLRELGWRGEGFRHKKGHEGSRLERLMSARLAIAYVLMFVMVVGVGGLLWRAIYFSERNVRRRSRRARRERSMTPSTDATADVGSTAEDS